MLCSPMFMRQHCMILIKPLLGSFFHDSMLFSLQEVCYCFKAKSLSQQSILTFYLTKTDCG